MHPAGLLAHRIRQAIGETGARGDQLSIIPPHAQEARTPARFGDLQAKFIILGERTVGKGRVRPALAQREPVKRVMRKSAAHTRRG